MFDLKRDFLYVFTGLLFLLYLSFGRVCSSASSLFLNTVSERTVLTGTVWDIGQLAYQPDAGTYDKVFFHDDGARRLEFVSSGYCSFLVTLYEPDRTTSWRENVRVIDEVSSPAEKDVLAFNQVVDFTNRERVSAGLIPLRMSPDLQRAADIRAHELVALSSHTRPDGSSCITVFEDRGHMAGENIAGGSLDAADVVRDWMNSPGHRKNILNPSYREIGTGFYYDGNSYYKRYWVQLFRG